MVNPWYCRDEVKTVEEKVGRAGQYIQTHLEVYRPERQARQMFGALVGIHKPT